VSLYIRRSRQEDGSINEGSRPTKEVQRKGKKKLYRFLDGTLLYLFLKYKETVQLELTKPHFPITK
jgi:hypothetical protein